MPPDRSFQHHGELVETREQWAARQAAKQAEQAEQLAAAQRREAMAAAEARRRAAEAAADAGRRAAEAAAEADRRAAEAAAAVARRSQEVAPLVEEVYAERAPDRRPLIAGVVIALCVLCVTLAASQRERPPASSASDRSAEVVGPPPSAQPATVTASEGWGLVGTGRRNSQPRQRSWADAPTIEPQASGWWCICYETQAGAEHTACRRLATECAALRAMVQTQGTASIRAGSASAFGCRHVPGAYPWERLGHRSAWTASSFTGATQALNVCAL